MSFKSKTNHFSGSQCQFIGKVKHCTLAPTIHRPSPPPPKLPLPFSTLEIILGVEKAANDFKLPLEDIDINVQEGQEEGKVADVDAKDGHGKECRKSVAGRKRKFAQMELMDDDPIVILRDQKKKLRRGRGGRLPRVRREGQRLSPRKLALPASPRHWTDSQIDGQLQQGLKSTLVMWQTDDKGRVNTLKNRLKDLRDRKLLEYGQAQALANAHRGDDDDDDPEDDPEADQVTTPPRPVSRATYMDIDLSPSEFWSRLPSSPDVSDNGDAGNSYNVDVNALSQRLAQRGGSDESGGGNDEQKLQPQQQEEEKQQSQQQEEEQQSQQHQQAQREEEEEQKFANVYVPESLARNECVDFFRFLDARDPDRYLFDNDVHRRLVDNGIYRVGVLKKMTRDDIAAVLCGAQYVAIMSLRDIVESESESESKQ